MSNKNKITKRGSRNSEKRHIMADLRMVISHIPVSLRRLPLRLSSNSAGAVHKERLRVPASLHEMKNTLLRILICFL